MLIPPSAQPEEEDSFLRSLPGPPDVVIADLYRPSQGQIDALRRGPWILVIFDDENNLLFDCDLLVNPNVNQVFSHRHTPGTTYLRGGDAVMLRRQFRHLPQYETSDALRRLLVCFGGSDPNDLTRRFIAWFDGDGLPQDVEAISVLVGEGYPPDETLFAQLAGESKLKVLRQQDEVASLMQQSDAGVFTAGTLAHEALAAGLPSLLTAVNDSQAWEAEALASTGAAVFLGRASALTREQLTAALDSLLEANTCSKASQAGQELIDGLGCERVAGLIVQIAGAGGMLST